MLVVGLTGSIGMGKSTVSAMLRDRGLPVHDADAEVHALYRGEAAEAIEKAFPGTTHAQGVDRNALSRHVLGDDAAMKRLEAIVHPLVRKRREAFLMDAGRNGAKIAVLDIPLLFETGSEAECDKVIVVSAPFDVQKARVLARGGMTEERFLAMLARQIPDDEKRRRADYVIENGGSRVETEAQLDAILAELAQ
jgi:dephospho-CoA kinase